MTYLLEEELNSQGIKTKTTLQIRLNNRVYVRVKTLPKQFYDRAKRIKNEYDKSNIDTLLIEHKNWIAIWVEQQKNELDRTESEYLYQIQNRHRQSEYSDYPSKNTPKRYSLRDEDFVELQEITPQSASERYRSVIYEEDFFENAYSNNDLPKSDKRYRGIIYKDKVSDNPSTKVAKSNKFERKYRGYTY